MKKTVRSIVLKNKLWLSIAVVSIIGVSASEVAKAYIIQYILDVIKQPEADDDVYLR